MSDTSTSNAAVADEVSRLVTDYLEAFYLGDHERARPLLADDFSFRGPFVQVTGRDAFLDSAAGLRPIVRGHRLVRQWRDDEDVCTIYDVDIKTPINEGTVRMAEWHTVREGRLAAATVLFDSAELAALLPGR